MDNFTLDKFQKEAIDSARNGNSVIVSAPTGAGKTLIAEHIIKDCINKNTGIIYTAPIKALSNQKFRDFSKKYPSKVGIITGDVSINSNSPILIMTTEIFRNAILVDPKRFQKINWVIFDEIHYLDDVERGTVWEEAIILLPPQMRMLALSATIPNIAEFVAWLKKIHNHPITSVIEEHRPVPLHFFFQSDNKIFNNIDEFKRTDLLFRKLKNPSHCEHYHHSAANQIKTLIQYINKNEIYPCVYFSFSRRRCEALAQEVSYFDFLSSEEKKKIVKIFDRLIEKFNVSSSPHINFLIPLIEKGIAYHHAGLLPTLKEIIEQLFTTGLIKLIFTTETFALGINMPVKTVTFDTLSKFYGKYYGYLKTRDFYQMAGRAGRRNIDQEGFVISRINPSHIDAVSLEKVLYGGYEPIVSQLNSCYATILNLYKIMKDTIYEIYPNSFHFYQKKPWEKKETLDLLKRKIALLKNMKYIDHALLTEKAHLASRVYSFELSIGELFEQKHFDGLDEESLFILINALVYEPRKGEQRPRLNKKIRKLKKDLSKQTRSIHKKERSFRIYPLSKKFFFHLADASRAWFEGIQFIKLEKYCSVDEGEIVRYFRMGIQVLRQLHSSEITNISLKKKIHNCLIRVNRDIINAEKQLRQEI